MRSALLVLALLLTVDAALAPPAWGEGRLVRGEGWADAAACPRPEDRQALYRRCGLADASVWRLELPVWIPGITGTFADGESSVESDRPLGDVLGDLGETVTGIRFAFVGRVARRLGCWAVNVDGFGASNDGRWRVTGRERLGVGGNLKARLLRADVSVAFLDRPVAFGARWTRLRAHAYAGARFYDVRLDVPRVLGFVTGLDASDEWVDPILGLRVAWALSRRFTLRAESDLGGFGLGSDVAWWISATLEVRVTKVVSVGLGFNHLRFTRDLREVGRRLDWDLELSGPTLSIGFRF